MPQAASVLEKGRYVINHLATYFSAITIEKHRSYPDSPSKDNLPISPAFT
jgi:hypothetical protein